MVVQEKQIFCFWLAYDISGLAEVQAMKSDCKVALPKIRFVLVGRISYIKVILQVSVELGQNMPYNIIEFMGILKQYPADINLARKRCRCAYDDSFLTNSLRSVHA